MPLRRPDDSNRRLIPGCIAMALAALALGGCVSAGYVANKIVSAPNGGRPEPPAGPLGKIASVFYTRELQATVGPPPATLAAAIIAPRNYGFGATAKWGENSKSLTLQWRIQNGTESEQPQNLTGAAAVQYYRHMMLTALPRLPVCRPAGTVILLPGWGEAKETLLGYALDFASHGYRVVMVDLRGQGESSGRYVTYGLIEHHDITQLISALQARGLIAGKLALVGVSAGATVALDTVASDRRIAAIVAVAPFVNLQTAVRGVGNAFMPTLSKMVSEDKLTHALKLAGQEVGMNLADANPSSRVGNIHVPVLYVAGGKDRISPPDEVRAMAAKTAQATFVEVADYPHPALYFGVAKVAPLALEFLGKTLGPSPDPTCLAAPPPQDARYDITFTFELKKHQ